MKNLIGIFLICIALTSCINSIGTGVFRCKVEGNINNNIVIYTVKPPNGKKIKNFIVNNIQVSEKLDSTIWEKIWVEEELKPIKGTILYGQTNEDKIHPFLSAKELREKATYRINYNLSSYWYGYGICNCSFKVDENGNVAAPPID